jgi:hypothetical protein
LRKLPNDYCSIVITWNVKVRITCTDYELCHAAMQEICGYAEDALKTGGKKKPELML